MIFAILFAYYGYKKANDSGRNGIVWAIVALSAFIGTQLIIGLAIGIAILLVSDELNAENLLDKYAVLINIVAIIGGFISGFLVLWYLGRTPKITDDYVEPPPPPNFSGS